jgi:hypothetical protein
MITQYQKTNKTLNQTNMIKNTVTRGKTNVYQEKKIIVNEGSQTFKIDTPTISVKEQDAVIHNYDLCINKTPMNSSNCENPKNSINSNQIHKEPIKINHPKRHKETLI